MGDQSNDRCEQHLVAELDGAAEASELAVQRTRIMLNLVSLDGEILDRLPFWSTDTGMEVFEAVRQQLNGSCDKAVLDHKVLNTCSFSLHSLGASDDSNLYVVQTISVNDALDFCLPAFERDVRLPQVCALLRDLHMGAFDPHSPGCQMRYALRIRMEEAPPDAPEMKEALLAELGTPRVAAADTHEVLNTLKLWSGHLLALETWPTFSMSYLSRRCTFGYPSFKNEGIRCIVETCRLFSRPQFENRSWWRGAEFPLMWTRYDRGRVSGIRIMEPTTGTANFFSDHRALRLQPLCIGTNWDLASCEELSMHLLASAVADGLTATGAVSALGIAHRLVAGVPVVLVYRGDPDLVPASFLGIVASMLHLRLEEVVVHGNTARGHIDAILADAARAQRRRLLALTCVGFPDNQTVELLQYALERSQPAESDTSTTCCSIVAVVQSEHVDALLELFREAFVYLCN